MSIENRLGTLPEEAIVRRERLVMAKRFLGDVILPLVARHEELDYKRVEALADGFREKYQEQKGSDFELPHVWPMARGYLINVTYAAENIKTLSPRNSTLHNAPMIS